MRFLAIAVACAWSLTAATVDGIHIHSSSAGKGPRTVILVHGWTCDETTWSEQVPVLAKQYRVLTLDLPGHGKSGAPADGRLSMDLFARAVEAVRAEAKADHVVLVGHSMGTPVIVQYARLYPQHVTALVFVDGLVSLGNGRGPAPDPKQMSGPDGKKNREIMIRGMFSTSTTPANQTKILDMMLAAPESTAVGAMNATFDPAIWKGDVLSMPILGIYADKSGLNNPAYMKEHFPNLEYHEVAGTGHFVMLDNPSQFNALLLEFLDRQQLLSMLHIQSLRPGADARNPESPHAVNYDEAKANPYPNVPDPLVLKNGTRVTSAKMWWDRRRPEIVEDFDREVYGRVPKNIPNVKWEITSTTQEMNGEIPAITKQLLGHVDTVEIKLTLTTPASAPGPVPVIMELAFQFPAGRTPPQPAGPTWQQQVLAKGWGYASLIPTSIQPDNGQGLSQGIIGLMNKGEPRKLDDWGALRAWAWGASRALDYFETDKSVDARRVGIEGMSRYGKAALVAMAYDSRFAAGFIASSGEGGAKLHRRNFGELLENVAALNEYHWMAGNFLKYAGPLTANDLPVDSHELIALCAPRPIFISAGSLEGGDGWVDAKGMFLAEADAGPVYELLGKKGLGATEMPPVETALVSGDLAFRQHNAGHTAGPNWPAFLTFASRYLSRNAATASLQRF
jgi:(4-O-methyl)-D-glucuronate---lignin esterase